MTLGYEDLVGAIYDVDDTLLSNRPNDGNPHNLHERSRLAAIHQVGQELGHASLQQITPEENREAFRHAPQHTVEAAVWSLLCTYGLAKGQIDLEHPLLDAIVTRKVDLHESLLREKGVEVPGASTFITSWDGGSPSPQAIASGARLSEITIFLEKYGLLPIIPRERTVAYGDYRQPKPDSEPFDKAFLTLQLDDTPTNRARTLAVEDDPKGTLSASRAGLYVCALTTRFSADELIQQGPRPHIIAANMTELGQALSLPQH